MVFTLDRWVGKVAVVTGASSGIGASIAEELVNHGLIVAGIARRVERIEDNSKQLLNKPGKLIGYKADLTKEDEIIATIQTINNDLGPISILINNAGLIKQTTLIEGDTAIWREIFDLNVLSLCIATREVVNIMRKNQINGHIIHINSTSGHTVPNFPYMNVYPASKHAVTALAETLRQELMRVGSKIKISSLSPGFVATEMTTLNENHTADIKEALSQLPALQSKDIADAAVYILSTPENVQVEELIVKPVGEPF